MKQFYWELCYSLPVPMHETIKSVWFSKLEIIVPLPDTKAVVIIRLLNATLIINEGDIQQTMQTVLLAL